MSFKVTMSLAKIIVVQRFSNPKYKNLGLASFDNWNLIRTTPLLLNHSALSGSHSFLSSAALMEASAVEGALIRSLR